MAQGQGGQVNVNTPRRRNNTPAIVAAVIAALLLLALILWFLFRPRDVNVSVTGPTATPTAQVVVVEVTPTPEPPTQTPVVTVVEVTPTPEPPSPTAVVQTVVVTVEVTTTPEPAGPTATPVVVVVTNTPGPTQPAPSPTTQPLPSPSPVPTLTSEESQIASTLQQAPGGDQLVYVHRDGNNLQIYFNIMQKATLPEAALQAKQQLKDLLQQLVQVEQTYGQATFYGYYPSQALTQNGGTPAPAQAGEANTVVVEATFNYDTIENSDWGNLPPEPIYEQAQSSNIHPLFAEAGNR